MDTGTAGTGTAFHAGTGHFGKFGTTSEPVPDTSVRSVQRQDRYRKVRYINIGNEPVGKFGTASIPVPDTSVSSVRHQYGHRTLR